MGRKRKYDHDAILADWLAGLSTKEIAAKYGCSGNLGAQLANQRRVKRSPTVVKMALKRRRELAKQALDKSLKTAKRISKNKRIAAYAMRHGVPAAAAKHGLHHSSAWLIAKRHGWKPTWFDQAAILKDFMAGMKLRQIAEKYGCEESYASKLAKRLGKSEERKANKRQGRA